ncbi:hypothetical protein TcCL_NonESM11561 [Trypanosoma cruzi]|nr:hypothetical protein TcCL_NonESM11561 [Trypanosoma cruzi]
MCEIAGAIATFIVGRQREDPGAHHSRGTTATAAASFCSWAPSVSARFLAPLPAAPPPCFVMRGPLCRLRCLKKLPRRGRFPRMLTVLVAGRGGQKVRSDLPRRCRVERGFLSVAQRFVFTVRAFLSKRFHAVFGCGGAADRSRLAGRRRSL